METLPERRINYRELQGIAKKMNLPGNLKYNLLMEIINARKNGNEDIVERILGEQRLERVRRKQEKLGSQESAYQHLRMTSPRVTQNVSQQYHNGYASQPTNANGISGYPPKIQFAGLNCNNMPASKVSTHFPPGTSKPWTGVTNMFNTNVRTILQMPQDVYNDYHKKAREQSLAKIQEVHQKNPPVTYAEWLKAVEHKRSRCSTPTNGFVNDNTGSRGFNNGYHVETEDISPQEDQRKSFQMKDILNYPQGNFTPYFSGNQYDWNQLHCDIPQISSDNFTPPNYLPSMSSWKNIYEPAPHSTYDQHHYSDYSTQQGPSSSNANTSEVSPQNSDTVSATDEDLPKENMNEVSGQMSLPLHRSYITTTQRAVQYLAQLDYEEPSTSNVPDLSSSGERNITAISSEKEDLDSSDTSFLIIDPGDEFSNPSPGDII